MDPEHGRIAGDGPARTDRPRSTDDRRFARLIAAADRPPAVSGPALAGAVAGILGGLVLACIARLDDLARGRGGSFMASQPYQIDVPRHRARPSAPALVSAGGRRPSSSGCMGRPGRRRVRSRASTSTSSELRREFRLYCLGGTSRCGSKRRGPNRVIVQLDYREPVAVERLQDGTERTVCSTDEGVILPREDVDPEHAGRSDPARQARAAVRARPAGRKSGASSKRQRARSSPTSASLAAVELAAFLERALGASRAGHRRRSRPSSIHPLERRTDLYVQIGE